MLHSTREGLTTRPVPCGPGRDSDWPYWTRTSREEHSSPAGYGPDSARAPSGALSLALRRGPGPGRARRDRPGRPAGPRTPRMHTLPHWERPRTARPPAPRGLGLRELPLSRVVVRIRVTRGLHSSGPGRTVAHCATWPPPGGVPPCPARRARSRPLPLGQHTVSMYIQTPGTRPRAALPRLRGRSNRAGPGEAAAEPDGGERAASGGLRRPPAATAAAAAVGSALPFPWSGGSSSGRPPPPPASSGSSDGPPPPLKQQQHHRTRRAPPPAGPA